MPTGKTGVALHYISKKRWKNKKVTNRDEKENMLLMKSISNSILETIKEIYLIQFLVLIQSMKNMNILKSYFWHFEIYYTTLPEAQTGKMENWQN